MKETTEEKAEVKEPFKLLTRSNIETVLLLTFVVVLFTTDAGTWLRAKMQQALLFTGMVTPEIHHDPQALSNAELDMPLIRFDGEAANLTDFRGKVIFINFWATWCPPCIAEMPNIQGLYDKVDRDKVAFVMLSLDDNTKTAMDWVNDKGFTFPIYFPSGRTPQALYSSVIPSTFVIDPTGNLVASKMGMANYDSKAFRDYLEGLADPPAKVVPQPSASH